MKSTSAVLFAALLGLPSVAVAQVEDADTDVGATAEKESPTGKPWPRGGDLQFRFVYHDSRLELEADHVKGTNMPVGTGFANTKTNYDVRHTEARLEAAYGIELSESIPIELYGGLGWGETSLTVEAERGSPIGLPTGPDFSTTAESEPDFNLNLGAKVRMFFTDTIFFGVGYEFLYGRTDLENQVFYSIVDGELEFMIHDLSFQIGYSADFLSAWVGLGFLVYDSDLELEERVGLDKWDVELDQGDNYIKGSIGIALHPGEHLMVMVEFEFQPELGTRIALGWTF